MLVLKRRQISNTSTIIKCNQNKTSSDTTIHYNFCKIFAKYVTSIQTCVLKILVPQTLQSTTHKVHTKTDFVKNGKVEKNVELQILYKSLKAIELMD